MPRKPKFTHLAQTILLLVITSALFIGCAEQPTGYVYRPLERDVVSMSRITVDVVSSLYDQLDIAVGFLEDASQTSNYATILPAGWMEAPMQDTLTGDWYTIYYYNYLDQSYQGLRFDKNPDPQAIRTPSNIEYQYTTLRNFFNERNSEFYIDIEQNQYMVIEYADNRQNPDLVEGWFSVRRAVEFIEEITIGDFETTYSYYQYPSWIIRIKDYTTDPDDNAGRLIIEGTFPHRDELDNFRNDHVSGEITLKEDGSGSGEMRLFGEPVSKIHFTSRGAGFVGYFTLESEEHSLRHRF